MKSKPNNKSESQASIIFKQLSSNQLHDVLENNGATKKETKAVFLMRDNSPGLMTVSYYSQEQEMVKHLKLGLTREGWKTVPKSPKEPKVTDTIEVKSKYMQTKAKYDEEIQNFINTAKMLFEQIIMQEQIRTLCFELLKNDFNLQGLIKPDQVQASQYYSTYVSATISEHIPDLKKTKT